MPATLEPSALRLRIRGRVQGVGFRPFVFRLAHAHGLAGWVYNDGDGVLIHVEGSSEDLDRFVSAVRAEAPPRTHLESVDQEPTELTGTPSFQILPQPTYPSDRQHHEPLAIARARVPHDRATCSGCLEDILSPTDHRRRYPFTTCTVCGPRYSVLEQLPYERRHTSMHGFPPCPWCAREFDDPTNRRFHAEPIACSTCGPRVTFRAAQAPSCTGEPALAAAAGALRQGRILALQGLGGFQLLVRADSSRAVRRLRKRKHRPTKPLAVMVRSLDQARSLACIGPMEQQLLESPDNPIVLVEKRAASLVPEIAPRLNHVGILLPTTPLHHLLLEHLDFPVVATSGNRSEEPILTDEAEAFLLEDIADAFLVHDRPIRRRVDDSVVRLIGERPVMLRLARGYAPWPLPALERWARSQPRVLALGGQQKSSLALWNGAQAVLSPHLGDLDSSAARAAYVYQMGDFSQLYGCDPSILVGDMHPEYFTTRWGQESGKAFMQVQHHHAHAVAVMVEHDLLDRQVLALTWDGTGFGPDQTIWGGEILSARAQAYERIASLDLFPLPGGETAIREPGRVALGLLAKTLGADLVLSDKALLDHLGMSANKAETLLRMIDQGINTPWTSSMGRLFDAVAALLLPIGSVTYEGEAAAWLEAIADSTTAEEYRPDPTIWVRGSPTGLNWRPLIRGLWADRKSGVHPEMSAAKFHNTLARWAADIAQSRPEQEVVLGGGCFQNALLTLRVRDALEQIGRHVYLPGHIPPNDGGLAVGQLAVAMAQMRNHESCD